MSLRLWEALEWNQILGLIGFLVWYTRVSLIDQWFEYSICSTSPKISISLRKILHIFQAETTSFLASIHIWLKEGYRNRHILILTNSSNLGLTVHTSSKLVCSIWQLCLVSLSSRWHVAGVSDHQSKLENTYPNQRASISLSGIQTFKLYYSINQWTSEK